MDRIEAGWFGFTCALVLMALVILVLRISGYQGAIKTEQQRVACMLATDDEHENEKCLPPVYGEDW